MPARVTVKIVNEELARLGHKVTLAKADSYFYFEGGEADTWLDRTVRVSTLSSLTLEEWVGEYLRLKKLNADILAGSAGNKRTRKAK